jgi:AcrR family transcriptional regulator
MDNAAMSDSPADRPAYTRISRKHKGVDVEVRQQERRQKLFEAGLELLGTKGFHTTTVREVCTAAGLSERYFYESFSSLGALFEAIYQDMHIKLLGQLMSTFVASRSDPSPDVIKTARAAVAGWLNYMKEDPRRARILLIDAMSADDKSQRNALAATRDYVATIQTFVEMLFPGVSQMALSPRMLAAMLFGACIHAAREWQRDDMRMPVEVVTEHLTTVFKALLAHYEASHPKPGHRAN